MYSIKPEEPNTSLIFIKMFGEFDILYKGNTLLDQSSHSQKSLDILRYLIVHHDKSMLPENISNMIWPENDYSDIRNVIRTYIFRLKKILSTDNAQAQDITKHITITNSKGKYKATLSNQCTLDLNEFDKLVELLEITEDTDKRLEYLLKLISYYNGEFLKGCTNVSWIVSYRKYYENVFITSTIELLDILLLKKETDLIIKICKKVLDINNNNEKINIHYIQALLEKKEYDEAVSLYNSYTARVYSKNGSSPSDDLQRLYIKLRQMASPNPKNHLDDSKFWEMMNSLLETYSESKVMDIAIGNVTVSPRHKVQLSRVEIFMAMQHLQSSLDYVLRKDDVFSIFDNMGAIFVLRNTTEDYFPVITTRIKEAFTNKCTLPIEIKITIRPVVQRSSTKK